MLKTIAPETLRTLHERHPRGQVATVLGRLLMDAGMAKAWRELAKKTKYDREWIELWIAIRNAFMYSARVGRGPSRKRQIKDFDAVSTRAKALAKLIDGRELDLLAYELFPSEDMHLLGVTDWERLDPLGRNDAANRLLCHWPSATDLLNQLAHHAALRAHNVRQTPRLIERTTRDARKIAFVRLLAAHFQRKYGTRMYGTLAAISRAVLQDDCSKAFVANTVKRASRKGDFSLPV